MALFKAAACNRVYGRKCKRAGQAPERAQQVSVMEKIV
jgi:hypothetical protein